jgi:hypothetical protein
MGRLTFYILDEQHQEFLIACLLPHIYCSLTQHKVMLLPEALEIATKLEEPPIGYGT